MKEEIKKSYRGFRGWIQYIRDYKDNVENESIMEGALSEANKKIKRVEDKYKLKVTELENELKEKEYLAIEKDKLLEKRNKRIEILNKDFSDLKKRCSELRDLVSNLSKTVDKQKIDLNKKEKQRRKNAGAIGGLKAEINKLNYTIDFYRKNRKKPTLEELKAYEYSRKEVEKRQKTVNLKDSNITTGAIENVNTTTLNEESIILTTDDKK